MWRFSCLVLVVACTKPNPESCADNFCEDPTRPFCDVDGSFSGTADTCIAVTCVPLAFDRCRDDAALVCNETGDNYDITNCPLGCGSDGCIPCEEGSPECPLPTTHIDPHYLSGACDELTQSPALIVSSDTTLDTSMPTTCSGGVVTLSSNLEVCIVRARSMAVNATTTLKVVGDRAIAFISDGEISIEGTVDVGADRYTSGPGGGHRRSGANTGAPGFATSGGGGTHPEAVIGPATMDPADGDLLFGGATAMDTVPSGLSGGGGGTLLLVSCRAGVSIGGLIDAGGGGGAGARMPVGMTPARAGGSGGSGGYVVLQGLRATVTGSIFANGGGGGGGYVVFGQPDPQGLDGAVTTSFATTGGGRGGGNGGQQGSLPSAGVPPENNPPTGGGGSMGMTQIFTPTNNPPSTAGAMVSPDFRPHRTVETK